MFLIRRFRVSVVPILQWNILIVRPSSVTDNLRGRDGIIHLGLWQVKIYNEKYIKNYRTGTSFTLNLLMMKFHYINEKTIMCLIVYIICWGTLPSSPHEICRTSFIYMENIIIFILLLYLYTKSLGIFIYILYLFIAIYNSSVQPFDMVKAKLF